jgi:eukaryotic-like serine/threonine-protein kinase
MSELCTPGEALSLADLQRVVEICTRFEDEWLASRRPHIEDFLAPAAEPLRPELLRDLLRLDLRYRRQAGEAPTAGEYHRRMPEYGAVIDGVFAPAPQTPAAEALPATSPDLGATAPDLPPPAGGGVVAEVTPLELSESDEPLALPARAGRYRVEAMIAGGGMGVVLRARDPGLNRTLALKVLRRRYQGLPELERRFLEEAQVTGQLQHPSIPPVHEVGSLDDGQPFLAMKLIRGRTLEQLLGERKGPAEDLPRFLALYAQVCQAVAYAHSRGVIHRDLKPANIMVGAFGEVQVMDWGLAKVLGGRDVAEAGEASCIATARPAGEQTEHGRAMGTYAYMAPEQARGEVEALDERADVFGLGAILCVTLTGKPPYAGGSWDEVRLRAEAGDLAEAFARLGASGADGELVALAKACLAPQKEGRPRDAGAVAKAVAAYQAAVQERLRAAELERAAAEARAAEAQAKAAAERRARRFQAGLAAAVLLLVAGASLAGLWYARRRAERERELAVRDGEVTASLERAVTLGRQAEALDDDPYRQEGPLAAALAAARQARGIALSGESSEELRQRVGAVLAGLEQAEADRRFVLELEEIGLRAVEVTPRRRRSGLPRTAQRYAEAFEKYRLDVLTLDPAEAAARVRRHPRRVSLVGALLHWANLTPREAERERLGKVLDSVELDDSTFHGRWRQALKRRDLPALRRLAASRAVNTLPATYLLQRALELHQLDEVAAAGRLFRLGLQRFPDNFLFHHELARALAHGRPPQPEEAARLLTACVALRPRSPGAHYNLGNALRAKGDLDGAIRCFRRAVELDSKFGMAHNNLGNALADKGDLPEAIRCYRKAIEVDPANAKAHNNLGTVLREQKDLSGAIACFQQAIEADRNFAGAYTNLGNALKTKGDLDGAIRCFRKATQVDPQLATAHNHLGRALAEKKDLEGAIRCFRKAVEANPKFAAAHTNLGVALHHKGDVAGAISCYQKAIPLNPKDAHTHYNLGLALREKGDLVGATRSFQEAITLDPKDPHPRYSLANALRDQGDPDGAIRCYRQAIELEPGYAEAHCNLGHVLVRQGRFAEAVPALRRGHQLGSARPGWPYPSGRWLHRARQLEALDRKLAAVLDGKGKPADSAERLALAWLCRQPYKRLYARSARFSAEAFTEQPKSAEDLARGHRYHAACAAALAGGGQGKDAGKLDDKERARLRQQALDWLRADLAAWAKVVDEGPGEPRTTAQRRLHHWQKDPDLASLRDEGALAKLPADERAAWGKLWAAVDELLKRAGGGTRPALPPPSPPRYPAPAGGVAAGDSGGEEGAAPLVLHTGRHRDGAWGRLRAPPRAFLVRGWPEVCGVPPWGRGRSQAYELPPSNAPAVRAGHGE